MSLLPPTEHQIPGGGRWWGPVAAGEPAVTWEEQRVTLAAGGWAVTLSRLRPDRLAPALDAIGRHLAGLAWEQTRRADTPGRRLAALGRFRALLLSLAWAAHRGGLPPAAMVGQVPEYAARAIADWRAGQLRAGVAPPEPDAGRSAADRAGVMHLVRETLAAFPAAVVLPQHPWDEARWAVALGERLWQVEGEAAGRWGRWRVPPADDGRPAGERAAYLLATVAAWLQGLIPVLDGLIALGAREDLVARLPVALTGDRFLGGWFDWLALAAGPGAPPAGLLPDGLGQTDAVDLQERRFDPAGYLSANDRLERSAAALLRTAARPVPRYLDRLLELAPPLMLLPELQRAGVGVLRIQATVRGVGRGLWLAVRTIPTVRLGEPTPRPRWHACWWAADPASAASIPWSMPFGLWPWLHALAAALWHDLCTDATVVVGAAAPLAGPERRDRRRGREAGERRSVVSLPGRRHVRGPAPAALAAATAAGHGYRRLPRDWEERAERPDFLERREAAAERAEQHGHPPPPVGFTYVRPHLVTRGAVVPATRVRCQGLLALTLAAQGVGEADEA